MSETTTADIRAGFIECGLGDGSYIDQDDVRALNAREFDEWFDRMIAEVERAAAEKALTDAANELSLLDDGGKRGLAGHSKSSASAITHRHAVAVVRARAEAYRREGKE